MFKDISKGIGENVQVQTIIGSEHSDFNQFPHDLGHSGQR